MLEGLHDIVELSIRKANAQFTEAITAEEVISPPPLKLGDTEYELAWTNLALSILMTACGSPSKYAEWLEKGLEHPESHATLSSALIVAAEHKKKVGEGLDFNEEKITSMFIRVKNLYLASDIPHRTATVIMLYFVNKQLLYSGNKVKLNAIGSDQAKTDTEKKKVRDTKTKKKGMIASLITRP